MPTGCVYITQADVKVSIGTKVKYHTANDKKKIREASSKLNALDRAILEKCKEPMNVIRVLKAGKPYYDNGSRSFATTDEVLRAIRKLLKLGILIGR